MWYDTIILKIHPKGMANLKKRFLWTGTPVKKYSITPTFFNVFQRVGVQVPNYKKTSATNFFKEFFNRLNWPNLSSPYLSQPFPPNIRQGSPCLTSGVRLDPNLAFPKMANSVLGPTQCLPFLWKYIGRAGGIMQAWLIYFIKICCTRSIFHYFLEN